MPSPHLKIARFSVLLESGHAPRYLLEEVRCSSQKSCWLGLRPPSRADHHRNSRNRDHCQRYSLNQTLQGPNSPRSHPHRREPLQQHFLIRDPPQDLPLLLHLPQLQHSEVPPLDPPQDLRPDLHPSPLSHGWNTREQNLARSHC
ncbi:hypothetical protein PIB30_060657 [Stylosanthes scabra]|uniref:Uncharacterized protein n=1 Tax=Stylosanthes scabra TaxID=79078 RepID=A0ABU6UJP1_9FABA|nr:hypothetical protein [Stylosanthes scabra]